MNVLNGIGQGGDTFPAPVYARAALLQENGGRATLEGDLLVLAANRLRRGDGPLDLVLVAEDAETALLVRLPMGLSLAGVVAEREAILDSAATSPIAVVTGVSEAREQIAEGDLLIVDPERGRVLVEPDAGEFVRLQAERGHRASVRLGAAHIPARTQIGREVAVWTWVRDFADIDAALDAGADGIFLTVAGDILPTNDGETDAQLPRLLRAVGTWGGGDMAIASPFDALDLLALVVVTSRTTSLRWVLAADELPVSLDDLRAELSALVQEEREEDRQAEVPRLAAHAPASLDDVSGWDEVFLTPEGIARLTLSDSFDLPPLYALLLDDLSELEQSVSCGATGVVVTVQRVGETKDFIREQAY